MRRTQSLPREAFGAANLVTATAGGPIATLVPFVHDPSVGARGALLGHLFPALGIRIDRSCSGINFLVIATICFALVILRRPDAGCMRPLLALLACGGAYALTIVVNAGRIVTMAWAKQGGLHLAPQAHEAVGAFFFLGALLVAVLLLHRLLSAMPQRPPINSTP